MVSLAVLAACHVVVTAVDNVLLAPRNLKFRPHLTPSFLCHSTPTLLPPLTPTTRPTTPSPPRRQHPPPTRGTETSLPLLREGDLVLVVLCALQATVGRLLHAALPMRPLFVFFNETCLLYAYLAKQAPNPSNVLGVFGLSIRTTERDLDDEFSRFGRVEKVVIVYDQRVSFVTSHFDEDLLILHKSDRSRGFGFITMSTVEEAGRCIKELNGVVRCHLLVIVVRL